MGKLIVTEFMTLDGVGQAPGAPDEDPDGGFEHGGWMEPVADEESGSVMFDQAKSMEVSDLFAGAHPRPPTPIILVMLSREEQLPTSTAAGLLSGTPPVAA